MCKVHDAIISLGFREDRKGRYSRGRYTVTYKDTGVNRWQPHAPDSNRYLMRLYIDGKVAIAGTAWYAILNDVPRAQGDD